MLVDILPAVLLIYASLVIAKWVIYAKTAWRMTRMMIMFRRHPKSLTPNQFFAVFLVTTAVGLWFSTLWFLPKERMDFFRTVPDGELFNTMMKLTEEG